MTEIIRLPALYSEDEAASALCLSVDTLQRLRAQGRIRFRRIGTGQGRIKYTEADLWEYLESCKEGGCSPKRSANTESIGSANDREATSGTALGSTPPLDKHAAHRLAQQTLAKPNNGSLNGLWRAARLRTNDLPQ